MTVTATETLDTVASLPAITTSKTNLLKMVDRCGAKFNVAVAGISPLCGAQAYVRVKYATGDHKDLCAHHARKEEPFSGAVEVIDCREALNVKLDASPM